MTWWRSRPIGITYVHGEMCSGDAVERKLRLDHLPTLTKDGDVSKVVKFRIVKQAQALARKQA